MILSRPPSRLWPCLFLFLGVTVAQAADLPIDARLGDHVLLATYYEIQTDRCRALAPPNVRIVTPPTLGRATIAQVHQEAVRAEGRCPAMTVPVVKVYYRAMEIGRDTLAWEVRYQAAPQSLQAASATVQVTGRVSRR